MVDAPTGTGRLTGTYNGVDQEYTIVQNPDTRFGTSYHLLRNGSMTLLDSHDLQAMWAASTAAAGTAAPNEQTRTGRIEGTGADARWTSGGTSFKLSEVLAAAEAAGWQRPVQQTVAQTQPQPTQQDPQQETTVYTFTGGSINLAGETIAPSGTAPIVITARNNQITGITGAKLTDEQRRSLIGDPANGIQPAGMSDTYAQAAVDGTHTTLQISQPQTGLQGPTGPTLGRVAPTGPTLQRVAPGPQGSTLQRVAPGPTLQFAIRDPNRQQQPTAVPIPDITAQIEANITSPVTTQTRTRNVTSTVTHVVPGQVNPEELAAAQNNFQQTVGMSPEEYARRVEAMYAALGGAKAKAAANAAQAPVPAPQAGSVNGIATAENAARDNWNAMVANARARHLDIGGDLGAPGVSVEEASRRMRAAHQQGTLQATLNNAGTGQGQAGAAANHHYHAFLDAERLVAQQRAAYRQTHHGQDPEQVAAQIAAERARIERQNAAAQTTAINNDPTVQRLQGELAALETPEARAAAARLRAAQNPASTTTTSQQTTQVTETTTTRGPAVFTWQEGTATGDQLRDGVRSVVQAVAQNNNLTLPTDTAGQTALLGRVRNAQFDRYTAAVAARKDDKAFTHLEAYVANENASNAWHTARRQMEAAAGAIRIDGLGVSDEDLRLAREAVRASNTAVASSNGSVGNPPGSPAANSGRAEAQAHLDGLEAKKRVTTLLREKPQALKVFYEAADEYERLHRNDPTPPTAQQRAQGINQIVHDRWSNHMNDDGAWQAWRALGGDSNIGSRGTADLNLILQNRSQIEPHVARLAGLQQTADQRWAEYMGDSTHPGTYRALSAAREAGNFSHYLSASDQAAIRARHQTLVNNETTARNAWEGSIPGAIRAQGLGTGQSATPVADTTVGGVANRAAVTGTARLGTSGPTFKMVNDGHGHVTLQNENGTALTVDQRRQIAAAEGTANQLVVATNVTFAGRQVAGMGQGARIQLSAVDGVVAPIVGTGTGTGNAPSL